LQPYGVHHKVRLVGPVYPAARHWVRTDPWDENSKPFPIWCPAFNPDTEKFEGGKCLLHDDFDMSASRVFLSNAFVSIQDPRTKKYGPWSDTVFGVQLARNIGTEILNIMDVNEGVNPADPDHGRVLKIKIDIKKAVTDGRYSVQQDDTELPLTEEQRAVQLYNFDELMEFKSRQDMRKNLDNLGSPNYYYRKNGEPYTQDEFDEGTAWEGFTEGGEASSDEDSPPAEAGTEEVAEPEIEPEVQEEQAPAEEIVEPVVPPKVTAAKAATPSVTKSTVASTSAPNVGAKLSPKGKPIHEKCPAKFGDYAGHPQICTACLARPECVRASQAPSDDD